MTKAFASIKRGLQQAIRHRKGKRVAGLRPRLKNVTVTLDEATYARARVQAAERKMSLSRFIAETLRDSQRYSREYDRAMQAALAQKPLKLEGPYLKRDDLYARPRDLR